MMDDCIIISNLNDFIFCPVSIYFHNLYGDQDVLTYQSSCQINGSNAHEAVDKGNYSGKKNILTAVEVYSEKYNLVGKIDIYDADKRILTERKRQIKTILSVISENSICTSLRRTISKSAGNVFMNHLVTGD